MKKVAAIVLAAGRSTRMGAVNKLTVPLAGRPLVAHAVAEALASTARPVVVVTGHEADAVAAAITAALPGQPVTFIHNAAYATGLASSLQAGIAALPGDMDGAIILLGDMPVISASLLGRLMDAFSKAPEHAAVVPTCGGRWGNPVLLARRLFAPVMGLAGDEGARRLLAREAVLEIAVDDPGIVRDVDTPEALADMSRDFADSAKQAVHIKNHT
ncbi:nucleotidyltransferase family protein [Chelatococcus asaccharovorans]|uniref:Molybdenum cofactor cytidylyltransferase n=1 Tax=Chelatococcus asaccharovorans TaxID=28210 RepID=A0A2V3TW12_9HYPH|nr:nucleotidyltransferase family protein [Chelatococcus asaccharovorans]MBS7704144.1 nucleotidyltransferase family protein [Chelatococcus asaccharovorans]PXW53230.1 molybdenum cofactor cytidylyltransferase [Chelatococcus asaccharovorans]